MEEAVELHAVARFDFTSRLWIASPRERSDIQVPGRFRHQAFRRLAHVLENEYGQPVRLIEEFTIPESLLLELGRFHDSQAELQALEQRLHAERVRLANALLQCNLSQAEAAAQLRVTPNLLAAQLARHAMGTPQRKRGRPPKQREVAADGGDNHVLLARVSQA